MVAAPVVAVPEAEWGAQGECPVPAATAAAEGREAAAAAAALAVADPAAPTLGPLARDALWPRTRIVPVPASYSFSSTERLTKIMSAPIGVHLLARLMQIVL